MHLRSALKVAASHIKVLRHGAELDVLRAKNVAKLAQGLFGTNIRASIAGAVITGKQQLEFLSRLPAMPVAENPAGLGALDVGADLLSGEHTERKTRFEFLALCEQIRARYPAATRLAFILDNFSVHKGDDVRSWADANNAEFAYTPHYASWLNRIEPQFKGLRYFCLDGTDHPDHDTQARLISDDIDWRNSNRDNPKLRHLTRRKLTRKAA